MPALPPGPRDKQAFSLVELSIVLVILGLLVGGVLSGQSLIRAAELRSLSQDVSKYITATNIFKEKYFALPGDMTNATSFWLAQDPTPATCQITPSTDARTCDGNGDGFIGGSFGGAPAYEVFRYWQHLANAGIITGSFTGVAGSGGAMHAVLGVNTPLSKYAKTGFGLWYTTNVSGYFRAPNAHIIVMGGGHASSMPNMASIYPEDLWNVDMKFDDGKPAFGFIMTYNATLRPNCATSDTDTLAEYSVTTKTTACSGYILVR